MAQALRAGDEPWPSEPTTGEWSSGGPKKTSTGTPRGSRKVIVLDAAVGALGGDSAFTAPPAASTAAPTRREGGLVAYLPADRLHLVGVPRQHDHPRGPLVHPQVERVGDGPGALGEAERLDGQLAPPREVGGLQSGVAAGS